MTRTDEMIRTDGDTNRWNDRTDKMTRTGGMIRTDGMIRTGLILGASRRMPSYPSYGAARKRAGLCILAMWPFGPIAARKRAGP